MWLGGSKGPSVGSIAQLTIHKEACSGETAVKVLFKQQRETEMDQRLSKVKDRSGKKVSS
jgi:hypothetical protein